jgi:hypothetical protein
MRHALPDPVRPGARLVAVGAAMMLRSLGLVALLFALPGCNVRTVLERLTEARRLSSELLVLATKASEISNRAVMAETDEAVAALAREAEETGGAVERHAAALMTLLQDLDYSKEVELLKEFDNRFAAYRTLDRQILDLAVEGSNVKARRLSFGPALEAADQFQRALAGIAAAGASEWRVAALSATAVSRVREIQALHAPHIAEPDDAPMTRLEERMKASEVAARAALDAMEPLVQPGSRQTHRAARDALEQFLKINAQIVDLSRRNSNVRSLALSMNQKRTLAAACEDSLRALNEALSKRSFPGTR